MKFKDVNPAQRQVILDQIKALCDCNTCLYAERPCRNDCSPDDPDVCQGCYESWQDQLDQNFEAIKAQGRQ